MTTIVDETEKVIDDPEETVVDDTDDKVTDDAQAGIDAILEKHNFTSVEDLEAALDSSTTLKDLIGDRDAVKLIRDAETLQNYEKTWAQEDRQKLADEETPEETVVRLTKELEQTSKALEGKNLADQDANRLQKQIKAFEKVVSGEVSKEDFPEEMEKFLGIFTGLKHPANKVKLDDLVGAKNMAKNQVKLLKELEQVIIRRYIDGKANIVDVEEIAATDAPVDKGKMTKNLKDARKILQEKVLLILKGKV